MHWQILRWPFRIPALFSIGIYTLVAVAFSAFAKLNFWVAVLVLSLGLPVWYAVFGQLSIYADKLMTHAATGLFDEPIPSEADLNPFTQGLGVIYFAAHLIVFLILFHHGEPLSWWLLLPALLYPLLWISVVLDNSLLGGFHPAKVAQVVGGLSFTYPLAVLFISGSTGYMQYSLLYAEHIVHIPLSAVAFLYGNVLFGQLLYWRRRELNLHTKKSPEQTLAETMAAEKKVLDTLFHEIHRHANTGNYGTAIELVENWVAEDPPTLDPLMHERLLVFSDQRLYLEHTVRYLQRLVEREELRKAWALMKNALDRDPRFRPAGDTTLLELTRAAGREDAGLVNEVLKDFARAYPDSALIADAQFRRARVCIELLKDGDTGVRLLNEIAARYPEFARGDAYQRYRRRLKVH